jgi:hypothetical protein
MVIEEGTASTPRDEEIYLRSKQPENILNVN